MSVIQDELITGLNVIAIIKSGQTLTKRYNKLVVVDHTKLEGIQRFAYGESKYSARDIIKEYSSKSIEFSTLLMESTYLQLQDGHDSLRVQKYADRFNSLVLIKNALSGAVEGIKQISNTYKNDETLVQEYKTIITTIEYNVGIIQFKLDCLSKK